VTTDHNHLDAETVAAWMDGGLDATSLAAAEAHASNCERCQALLATVATTLPLDAPVVSGLSRMWKWWLAPLAATAAAVTMWMVVPQDPMRPGSVAPDTEMAQKPAEPAPSAQSPAPPAAVTEPSAKRESPPAAKPPSDARFAEPRRNVPGARADQAKAVEAETKLADAQANIRDAAPQRDRQEKREANLERAAAAPAEPARVAPAAPATGAADNTLGAVAQLRKQTAPLEFVSPDPRFRWRVTASTIEHSPNGGRDWIPVRITASEIITGGSAPAPRVCWVVGRRGLVLLATDGTNFTPLPFPERVDLTSITAADARRATVTTADGRTFHTEDSGRNWR
jgi:hypothetical protein